MTAPPPVSQRPVSIETSPDDLTLLRVETQRLERHAAGLDDAALRAPSRCPGWTRAHVLAHLAGNGRAIGNLARSAGGDPTPTYASRAARDDEIETGARASRQGLLDDLSTSAAALTDLLEQLPPAATPVETTIGLVRPDQITTLRLREVVLHHVDLDCGYTVADIPTDLARRLLADQVARLVAHPDCPPFALRSTERDRFSVGDGRPTISGSRAALLAWLARGDASGVEAPDPASLPSLPDLEASAR